MKKTSKIIALMLVLMLGVIALTGCEFGGSKREINEKALTGYTEYTHSSGYKFKYPSNWTSNNIMGTIGFMNKTNGSNVNIISENMGNVNFKKSVEATVAQLEKQFSGNLKGSIETEYVKLNGKEAAILSYSMNQYNIDMKAKQVIVIDNGKAVVLTVTIRESSELTDGEIIDNIISTFKK